MRKKILLFADWYEPGYKAGGPIRSCVNFVRQMQDHYTIYVFTSDRDFGVSQPYAGVRTDEWVMSGEHVHLYYSSPGNTSWGNIRQQIQAVAPDFIYLNSMFSTRYTIFPLLISRMYGVRARIVLSPRGMLRASAVRFKSLKKQVFLRAFRWLGFHRSIYFLASDTTESADIRRYFGDRVVISVLSNFPAAVAESPVAVGKERGELSVIFVGRIHPVKNLDYLLEVLKGMKAQLRLTVVGSLENPSFWEKCRSILATLPANVRVEYAGEIPNHELPALLAAHHIFALPTRGENFGHAIYEALVLGRPVLISDQTPWRGLEKATAGWDLPLSRPDLFLDVLERAAAFDQAEYDRWSVSACRFAEETVSASNLKEEYQKLFS